MLSQFNISDLDDLRRAGKQASTYLGAKANVIRATSAREPAQFPHKRVKRRRLRAAHGSSAA